MEGVRTRIAAGLAALLVLLVCAVAARAQDDDPERGKAVQEIYEDYRDDGVIEACDHSKRALKKTLDQLPDTADVETPDLRPALEAGIEQHEADDCDEAEPTPTATPSPTAAPTSTPAPVPTSTPAPDTGDDSIGSVTPLPPGGGNDPPGAEDVTPLNPEITPVPPATTPAPAAPAEPSGAPPEPVYANEDDRLPAALLVLAGLAALVALLAFAYAALSRLGWADARLAGVRRAWREATFRIGGTWGDFADWIRVGR